MGDTGKRLAYVLRHHPESIGVTLDRNGWADAGAVCAGLGITRGELTDVVETDGKGRYELSRDGALVRARYGHSVNVDAGIVEAVPPDVLYHGTATRFLDRIRDEGLLPMGRMYVHLSTDYGTALSVGARHGRPIVLRIDAGAMSDDGYAFLVSTNGIWMSASVPPAYISVASVE